MYAVLYPAACTRQHPETKAEDGALWSPSDRQMPPDPQPTSAGYRKAGKGEQQFKMLKSGQGMCGTRLSSPSAFLTTRLALA